MKFRSFLKEKVWYIIITISILISIEIFLSMYDIDLWVRIYCFLSVLLSIILCIITEYYIKNNFYKNLVNRLNDLQEKYIINELIEDPNFIEGQILKNILDNTGKSMIENVNKYKHLTEDYKEYIELWIHEIKIPIATSKLIIENNKSEQMKSIDEELDKVENYIEQALYYARSNTVEKDYYIAKTNLMDIVNSTIMKNKSLLIEKNVNVEVNDLEKYVYTDSKWLVFILNQIIQNSIKYMDKEIKLINFYSKENKDNIILYIEDNGMGIKQSEISRVFEKGFTGENGRIIGKKSTGIGLYLCKKLCNKLGIAIDIFSEKGKKTILKIIFPKNSYINL